MSFDLTGEAELISDPSIIEEFDGYDLLAYVHEEARKKIRGILDSEEVIDLVFRNTETGRLSRGIRAGLLFAFGNTIVRLDGSTTAGAPVFSPGLTHLSPAFSFDDLLTRSHHLVVELGGESLVRSAIAGRPEMPDHVALAVTRTGSKISKITLVTEQPITGASWWEEEIADPLDVVWSDRFDHGMKEAVEALGRVLDRSDGLDHVYGAVLAELTGSPVEWVRSFLDGSSES